MKMNDYLFAIGFCGLMYGVGCYSQPVAAILGGLILMGLAMADKISYNLVNDVKSRDV